MQHVFLYRWQRMRRVKLGVRYLFLIEKTHTFLISVGDPAQLFSLQVLSVHRFLSPIGPLPTPCSVATDWTSPTSFINSQCKPVPFSRTKRRGEGTEAQRPCAGSFLQEAHGGPNFTFGNSLPQNLEGMSRSETKVVASVCHEMGLYKRNSPSQRVRWLPDAQTEGTAGLGQNCFKEKNTLRLVQCSSDGGSALENYKGSRGGQLTAYANSLAGFQLHVHSLPQDRPGENVPFPQSPFFHFPHKKAAFLPSLLCGTAQPGQGPEAVSTVTAPGQPSASHH